MAVRRQIDYAATRGAPWGISESAYNVVDRHGTYQYKAFGVPGLGLKRGLGDELVVAPYATALAVMIDPAASARNLRRLADGGPRGDYGFFDAIDYTDRERGRDATPADAAARRHRGPTVLRASRRHVAGRDGQRADRRPRWSRASTPTRACRRPSCCCRSACRASTATIEPRPLDEMRVVAPPPAMPVRRYRSPHTAFPHTQFLSNGNYVTVDHQRRRRQQLLRAAWR